MPKMYKFNRYLSHNATHFETRSRVAELIKHEENSLVFPPEDIEVLASFILRLIKDPDLSQQLVLSARYLVERDYSMDWYFGKYDVVQHFFTT